MRTLRLLFFLFVNMSALHAQMPSSGNFIKDMQWGIDYKIHLTLFNDSNYTINVQDLIHSRTYSSDTFSGEFVYYPVMLARDFVEKIQENNSVEVTSDTFTDNVKNLPVKQITLWSSLHESIGGGWVHFINCLLYSLETGYLSLKAPLMERPESSWKPKPVTLTYQRTRNWKYYVPVDQKQAQKEYFIKQKENQLDNLHDVPADFINLFLKTNNRRYRKIIESKEIAKQARIDLVKLLLGANYLGEAQIKYIKAIVQKSVLKYSYNQLPNVILFDDLDAAVVMSLNETGYNLERVVFRNGQDLSQSEKDERRRKIEITIHSINKANQKIFEDRLRKYYK